jgi:hypothetical protein
MHNEAFSAGGVIGRVAAFSGPVFVQKVSGRVDASKGLDLTESDQLETGAGGIVQVKFNDGTSFTVYENSSVKIDKYRAASRAARGATESAFDVFQGKLRFFVKPTKDKKNETQFRSQSAVMGIRGTSGLIGVNPSGETELVVFTGLVEVSNPKFPEMSISVAPNFQTKIVPGTAPQPPRPVSAEVMKSILPRVSNEGGFTEDGAESPQSNSKPVAPAPSGSPHESNGTESDKGETDRPDKTERKQPEKGEERVRRSTKPVFAPGGEVINTKTSAPTDSSPKFSRPENSSKEDTQAASSSSPAGSAQKQPVNSPAAMPTVEIDKLSAKVMNTIDRTQQAVKESVAPVNQPAKSQTLEPQKIKIKVSLPSD